MVKNMGISLSGLISKPYKNDLIEKICVIVGIDANVVKNNPEELIKRIENLCETEKQFEEYRKENAIIFKELNEIMERLEKGDLTVRINENRRHNKLQKTINRALDNLSKMTGDLKLQVIALNREIKNIKEEIERAKETSDQVADAASQVTTAATDQANKLQDISQDLENTGEVVEGTYNAAIDAVNSAEEIEENSKTGVQKVENAIDTMQRITNVIDDLGRAIQELSLIHI